MGRIMQVLTRFYIVIDISSFIGIFISTFFTSKTLFNKTAKTTYINILENFNTNDGRINKR